MKMKKIVLASVMSTMMFAIATPGFAMQQKQGHKMHHQSCECQHAKPYHRLWKHLTPAQQKTMKRIKRQTFKQMQPQLQVLRAKTAMLNALLLQPKINSDQINKIANEITQIHSQLFLTIVHSLIKVKQETGINVPFKPQHIRMYMMHHVFN